MLKMANSRSSVDHQTHKGFDISKKFWCHTSVDLGEQPPEVWVDLDELFGILLLLLTIHFAIVAVCTDICDDQWGRGVADEKNWRFFNFSAYRRPFEFSAYRRLSEYLLQTFYQFLFSCWRPFEISAYRRLFEISAYRRPSVDLLEALKKNRKK